MKKLASAALVFVLAFVFLSCPTVSAAAPALPVPGPSACAVVMNAKTGKIIYNYDMNVKCYPASITKIMTALLCFQYLKPDGSITISRAVLAATPADSSGIGVKFGETFTTEQAEYTMLLKSDNALANALAIYISGSPAKFAALMNKTAKSLGCKNTNFTNPSGYYDPKMVTTCYDMALIMQKALQDPNFVKVLSARQYKLTTKFRSVTLYNDDQMIFANSPYYDKNVVCGKTGYTDESRHTLATYADSSGSKVIVVVMHDTKTGKYDNTTKLLDYAFNRP